MLIADDPLLLPCVHCGQELRLVAGTHEAQQRTPLSWLPLPLPALPVLLALPALLAEGAAAAVTCVPSPSARPSGGMHAVCCAPA